MDGIIALQLAKKYADEHGGESIKDVKVNGVSIVADKVANITTSTGLESTSSGIGLTSAVQTSLGKADTAVQPTDTVVDDNNGDLSFKAAAAYDEGNGNLIIGGII